MFLKDFGLDETKFIKSGHGDHKLAAITTLIDFYPDLKFILIGDSGQHDAGIYRDAVDMHPGRIQAVYIRAVDGAPERDESARKLLDEIEQAGVQTALCDNLLIAARNAADRGWIKTEVEGGGRPRKDRSDPIARQTSSLLRISSISPIS